MYTSLTGNNANRPGSARYRFAVAIALILVALPAVALAQKNKSLPINIEANQANYSQQSGVSVYTGNVHMIRGGLTLTGDKLVVTRVNDHGNLKAVLTGSPAHIDKKPDSDSAERVTGHASQIEYTNSNAQLVLRGNAEVDRGGDQVRGQIITHDLDTDRTIAKSGSGDNDRVHVTIQADQADQANKGSP
ncbi:MAG: lipopolysaccharide transport periplasmic protein LptA [Salinisphaera sp.]|jgi:lipopolysaccharide export system protein LptA|nr:lipopolysaccharide transport periplasmic protein LptA [Salinisphaera sp.]